MIEVMNVWHKASEELPEEGREVLCAEVIDEECDTGERFGLMEDMYYFKKGTLLRVEPDRTFKCEWDGMKQKSTEERLLEAIFGEGDDIQEIEKDGWYTFDTLNEEELFRYRWINDTISEVAYWCYPMMPDGIEMNRRADRYEHNQGRH